MLTLITPKEMTSTSTNAGTSYPLWNSTTAYSVGTRITYNGYNYECLIANTDKVPDYYYGDYDKLKTVIDAYSGNTYSSGDIVFYKSGTKSSYFEPDATVIESVTARIKNPVPSYYTVYVYIVESIASSNTESPSILLNTGISAKWKYRGLEWSRISVDNSAVFYDVNNVSAATNSLSSVSSFDGTMICEFDASKMDSMALLKVLGASILVELRDRDTDEVYYTDTRSGLDTTLISNWYEYFTYEPVYLGNFYYDFPRYSNVYMHIEITPADDGYSRCSLILGGNKVQFGDVLFSPEYSLEDFSRKDTDDNGYVSLTEGRFRDKMDLEIIFPIGRTDFVLTKFKNYRAIPSVWIIDENYSNGVIYGFYSDLSVNFQTHKMAHASLTIESL